MRFCTRRAWHTFARRLVAKGLVRRYDKKVKGMGGRIVDGYRIIDQGGMEREFAS
jgi:hypothetical protein